MSDKKIMKKYLLAASLTALVVNISFAEKVGCKTAKSSSEQ
ncbi:hypothetical protein [uncultured Nostoc sp.]|nr:hypothetical protein [uncultured Nostoc sp.]